MGINRADVAELVDARDLKFLADTESVRLSCKTGSIRPAEVAANHPRLQNIQSEYRALHFVRFDDNYGPQFWGAVRAFGKPDFMHRNWDQRARREISAGDIVVFAKGDEDQPVSKFNGDDEFYSFAPSSYGRVGL